VSNPSFIVKLIRNIGVATTDDIFHLQKQIDEMNNKFEKQLEGVRVRHAESVTAFANHKGKTEEELKRFVGDVSQIITVMETLLDTAQSQAHLNEIKHMITALKTKRAKATTAINKIDLAGSENQIDVALAEIANG
jgi:hypothetical protein